MIAADKNRGWDEYKYRHEHRWNTVFKLTLAVVTLSAIPDMHQVVVCVLDWWVATLPVLAVGLALFGYKRMARELDLLNAIRTLHRRAQGTEEQFGKTDKFAQDVKVYLGVLIVAAGVNGIAMACLWRPALARTDTRECFPPPTSGLKPTTESAGSFATTLYASSEREPG